MPEGVPFLNLGVIQWLASIRQGSISSNVKKGTEQHNRVEVNGRSGDYNKEAKLVFSWSGPAAGLDFSLDRNFFNPEGGNRYIINT